MDGDFAAGLFGGPGEREPEPIYGGHPSVNSPDEQGPIHRHEHDPDEAPEPEPIHPTRPSRQDEPSEPTE